MGRHVSPKRKGQHMNNPFPFSAIVGQDEMIIVNTETMEYSERA